jgi:hypothetical protein
VIAPTADPLALGCLDKGEWQDFPRVEGTGIVSYPEAVETVSSQLDPVNEKLCFARVSETMPLLKSASDHFALSASFKLIDAKNP